MGKPVLRQAFCTFLVVAGLLALYPLPTAAADACKSHGYVELPVTLAAGVPVVRFTVSSKELLLILDTGAQSTVISTGAADRLQLPRSMVYPRRMRGLGGGLVGGAVGLPGLAVAGIELPNFGALVAPIELKLSGIVPDGLLGADILSDYDVDLDLARNRVRLWCSSGAPDWSRSYSTIEANRSLHDRLFFWSALDGKRTAVIIDTGAQHSLVDSRAALATGIDAKALGSQPAIAVLGISGSGGVQARPYRFRELAIGRERLAQPSLLVAPLGLEDADLILGADFMKDRRVRLSYRSRRIYIEPR
jgi:predicted aspartyl protease